MMQAVIQLMSAKMAASNGKIAAGLLIFRRLQDNRNPEYLLLQTSYGGHHWTPPKGHVDAGETEFETALRETEEEAGFRSDQLNIIKAFEKHLNYTVEGAPKRVVYWLSELRNPNDSVKLSHEHQDFKWLQLDEACKFARHADMIELLKEANSYILEKYNKL